jgi:hypothetical protein
MCATLLAGCQIVINLTTSLATSSPTLTRQRFAHGCKSVADGSAERQSRTTCLQTHPSLQSSVTALAHTQFSAPLLLVPCWLAHPGDPRNLGWSISYRPPQDADISSKNEDDEFRSRKEVDRENRKRVEPSPFDGISPCWHGRRHASVQEAFPSPFFLIISASDFVFIILTF